MKKLIAHYIFRDIFTAGYINFMNSEMVEFEHVFFVKRHPKVFRTGIASPKADELKVNISARVILIEEDEEFISNDEIRDIITACDKFIISGLFDSLKVFHKYPDSIWKKIYLQFWGGDFYCYRDMDENDPIWVERRESLIKGIEKCAAVLNVVASDYDKLRDVLKVDKLHFEAAMPEDPEARIDYTTFITKEKMDVDTNEDVVCNGDNGKSNSKDDRRIYKIVVGNSAAMDNCHLELFEKIKHLADKNVRIICPLSYGNAVYRTKVIEGGNRIFGDKFVPIMDYMSLEKYVSLLNECDCGIYNNNRQQGFKNITMMIMLGKKIYIRRDGAVWNKLHDIGVVTGCVDDIANIELDKISEIDEKTVAENRERMEAFTDSYHGQWLTVLSDRSCKTYMQRAYGPIDINVHVTDHCNLNCRGCSHYATIAKEWYLDVGEWERDLKKIKDKASIFDTLSLMGGEPLLHPELEKILVLSRTYLPDIIIRIVTNGILLNQMSDSFWRTCRNNRIAINITAYPINIDYNNLLIDIKSKEIECTLYVDRRQGSFRKDVMEDEGCQNKYLNYAKCKIGGVYPMLKDGKIYRCAHCANVDILNDAFGTKFVRTDEDYLLLDEVESIKDIQNFFAKASEFCKYCNLEKEIVEFKWDISKKDRCEWL